MTGGGTTVSISDTVIRDCNSITPNGGPGITVNGSGGTLNVTLENIEIHNCQYGVVASGTSNVMVRNSNLSNNTGGVEVLPGATVTLDTVVLAYGNTGVTAAGGQVRLSACTVTDNATGLFVTSGGAIISFNNNRIKLNGTDGNPTATYYVR